MYRITKADNIPAPKNLCLIGYPEDVVPDIVIYNDADPYKCIALNSKVLREALLSDPSFMLFDLGIKVEESKGRNVK